MGHVKEIVVLCHVHAQGRACLLHLLPDALHPGIGVPTTQDSDAVRRAVVAQIEGHGSSTTNRVTSQAGTVEPKVGLTDLTACHSDGLLDLTRSDETDGGFGLGNGADGGIVRRPGEATDSTDDLAPSQDGAKDWLTVPTLGPCLELSAVLLIFESDANKVGGPERGSVVGCLRSSSEEADVLDDDDLCSLLLSLGC